MKARHAHRKSLRQKIQATTPRRGLHSLYRHVEKLNENMEREDFKITATLFLRSLPQVQAQQKFFAKNKRKPYRRRVDKLLAKAKITGRRITGRSRGELLVIGKLV